MIFLKCRECGTAEAHPFSVTRVTIDTRQQATQASTQGRILADPATECQFLPLTKVVKWRNLAKPGTLIQLRCRKVASREAEKKIFLGPPWWSQVSVRLVVSVANRL
jgi:hypothetical protein